MPDIFVSYAHADLEQVKLLVDALTAQGWSVFWDTAIRAGKRFDRELDDALAASRCVLVVWTENSVKSDWVRTEAQFALDHDNLIPVRFDSVSLPPPFDLIQTANLVGWPSAANREPEAQRLMRDIAGRLGADPPSFGVDTSRPVPGFDGRAAVAVLPFDLLTSEGDHEYLADGICDDIITQLQRFRTFPVIARHSSFAYRGGTHDYRQVAEELGVGYLVIGSIRKQRDTVRISVELIEASSQHTIWSETYRRSFDNLLELQDTIATDIVARMEPEIQRAERRLAPFGKVTQAGVWHLIRRGLWHQYRMTRDDAAAAKRYFNQALLRDPSSVEALVQLGMWEWLDKATRRAKPAEWNTILTIAQRVMRIDPRDARAVTLLGMAEIMQRHYAVSRSLFMEAIELNPSYAQAYANLGTSHYLVGEPELAIEPLRNAMRLSPFDLYVFHAFGELSTAMFMLERWSEAVDAANHSLRLRAGYWLAHVVKVASLACSGQTGQAGDALATLRSHRPGFGLTDIDWIVFEDPKWNARLAEGLRLAGWGCT